MPMSVRSPMTRSSVLLPTPLLRRCQAQGGGEFSVRAGANGCHTRRTCGSPQGLFHPLLNPARRPLPRR